MRAVQVEKPGSPLELVERPVPEPGPGKVRIKVEACGICHSDSFDCPCRRRVQVIGTSMTRMRFRKRGKHQHDLPLNGGAAAP